MIPISSVRLVHPLPDPKTGKIRDVIIRVLEPINIVHDRPTRTCEFDRLVPGQNVIIPWPEKAPEDHTEYACDTPRLEAEERTFVPTLLRPPVPETIINELRNAYSIFRTRHTPEYIAAKEAEEAAKLARKQSTKSMILPVQEFNRKQRELRRARGQPELTPEMLEKIGQVIERNKNRRLGAGDAVIASAIEKLSLATDVSETTPESPPQSS
jgi:large subunit ribosomal protein L24